MDMSDIIITPVPVTLVNYMWSQCIPHLERVIEKSHGELSLETIKNQLLRGDSMLIACLDGSDVIAVNTLETTTFETGLKVMAVSCTGGNRLAEWKDRFLDIVNQIAKDAGCTQVRGFAARRGWVRELNKNCKGQEWEEIFTTITRDVF